MTQEKPFLEKLAAQYHKAFTAGQAPDIVVFPNRRAMSVFRRILTATSGKAMLLPALESIESYATQVSGYRQLSKREFLVPLYGIVQEAGQAESFEQFLNWAPTLIDDFNDIDDYLAEGASLFDYLSEARAIEMWNPSGQALSDFQKRFMEFWKSLPGLYAKVKAYTEREQCGTAGQVKRKAAEVLKKRQGFMGKRTWFAGFNALTPSEAALIEVLAEAGQVKIFWDAGRYYYGNFEHEAGKYIRYYHDKWGSSGISELLLHGGWENPQKKIHITGAPGLSGQALAAAEALTELRSRYPEKKIALVAAGMQAEQALAHVLPEGITLNFSPGIPFSLTPAAGFINLAWELWLKHDAKKGFTAAELCALLRNPLAAEMGGASAFKMIRDLEESGKPFVGRTEFAACSEETLFTWLSTFMYGKRENTRTWVEKLRALLMHFYNENYIKKTYDKRSIATGLAITAIDHYLKETEGLPTEEPDPFLGKRWMQQSIRELRIPVEGDPAATVQVMGLLESRNLDFDIVILVGANEGQLPAPAQPSSFIPFDIRQLYRLPGRSDRESVFAYHFYRMLQHPEEVVLIYNTEIDSFGSGEKSRYIQQLEFEWPQKLKGAVISHGVRKSLGVASEQRQVKAPKSEWAIQAIRERLSYGLSPTALNSYRNCTLQFYLRYLLRLQEAAEQNSVLGPDTLGSALHFTFEHIYQQDIGKPLSIAALNKAKQNINDLVEAGIKEAFEHADLSGGKNLLLKEMSETLVRKVIDHDIDRINAGRAIRILSVEENLEATLSLHGENIKFRGKADRIEEAGGYITVVDYKTGKADKKDLRLKSVGDFSTEFKDKAFQLMMYRWMYEKMHNVKNTSAGILSVKKPSDGILILAIEDDQESITQFENYVSNLVAEMLDKEQDFVQTDDEERCGYCEFKRLCARV